MVIKVDKRPNKLTAIITAICTAAYIGMVCIILPQPAQAQPYEAETVEAAAESAKVIAVAYAAAVAKTEPATEPEPAWEYIGEFTLTSYCSCPRCCGIWSEQHPKRIGTDYIQRTASGTIPEAGRTVGANIAMLPYGTVIYIDGLGEYVVEDTGGAAKRNKFLIDVFAASHADAVDFAKQKADVWVKK